MQDNFDDLLMKKCSDLSSNVYYKVVLMCIQNKTKKNIKAKDVHDFLSTYGNINKILVCEKGILTKIFIEFINEEVAKNVIDMFKGSTEFSGVKLYPSTHNYLVVSDLSIKDEDGYINPASLTAEHKDSAESKVLGYQNPDSNPNGIYSDINHNYYQKNFTIEDNSVINITSGGINSHGTNPMLNTNTSFEQSFYPNRDMEVSHEITRTIDVQDNSQMQQKNYSSNNNHVFTLKQQQQYPHSYNGAQREHQNLQMEPNQQYQGYDQKTQPQQYRPHQPYQQYQGYQDQYQGYQDQYQGYQDQYQGYQDQLQQQNKLTKNQQNHNDYNNGNSEQLFLQKQENFNQEKHDEFSQQQNDMQQHQYYHHGGTLKQQAQYQRDDPHHFSASFNQSNQQQAYYQHHEETTRHNHEKFYQEDIYDRQPQAPYHQPKPNQFKREPNEYYHEETSQKNQECYYQERQGYYGSQQNPNQSQTQQSLNGFSDTQLQQNPKQYQQGYYGNQGYYHNQNMAYNYQQNCNVKPQNHVSQQQIPYQQQLNQIQPIPNNCNFLEGNCLQSQGNYHQQQKQVQFSPNGMYNGHTGHHQQISNQEGNHCLVGPNLPQNNGIQQLPPSTANKVLINYSSGDHKQIQNQPQNLILQQKQPIYINPFLNCAKSGEKHQSASCVVFIKGLAKLNLNCLMIANFFGLYGNIKKVLIDKLKDYSLVEYLNIGSAENARNIFYNVKQKSTCIKVSYSYYEEIKLKNFNTYQEFQLLDKSNHRYPTDEPATTHIYPSKIIEITTEPIKSSQSPTNTRTENKVIIMDQKNFSCEESDEKKNGSGNNKISPLDTADTENQNRGTSGDDNKGSSDNNKGSSDNNKGSSGNEQINSYNLISNQKKSDEDSDNKPKVGDNSGNDNIENIENDNNKSSGKVIFEVGCNGNERDVGKNQNPEEQRILCKIRKAKEKKLKKKAAKANARLKNEESGEMIKLVMEQNFTNIKLKTENSKLNVFYNKFTKMDDSIMAMCLLQGYKIDSERQIHIKFKKIVGEIGNTAQLDSKNNTNLENINQQQQAVLKNATTTKPAKKSNNLATNALKNPTIDKIIKMEQHKNFLSDSRVENQNSLFNSDNNKVVETTTNKKKITKEEKINKKLTDSRKVKRNKRRNSCTNLLKTDMSILIEEKLPLKRKHSLDSKRMKRTNSKRLTFQKKHKY